MRQLFIVIFILGFFQFSNAQEEIGDVFDINGYHFHGYYDPVIYFPKKTISYSQALEDFKPGSYYTAEGKKIDGYLRYIKNKMEFTDSTEGKSSVLSPLDITSLSIGSDSFLVVRAYSFNGKYVDKPCFMQFVAQVDSVTYCRMYLYTNKFKGIETENGLIISDFRMVDGVARSLTHSKASFKSLAPIYFGDVPGVKDGIINNKFKNDDWLSLIKLSSYYDHYRKNKVLYFTKYWKNVQPGKPYQYTAKFTECNDSTWKLVYYYGQQRLYEISYLSMFPQILNGEFNAYFPNGQLRLNIMFDNNLPVTTVYCTEDGKVNLIYTSERANGYNKTKVRFKNTYKWIGDSLGNNLIGGSGDFLLPAFNVRLQKTYTHQFEDSILVSSYRISGQDTVYQICDPTFLFATNDLNEKFQAYFNSEKVKSRLSEDLLGVVFVTLEIGADRKLKGFTRLNSLHPSFDTELENFLFELLNSEKLKDVKFMSYKLNDENKNYEVTIPFEFIQGVNYTLPVEYVKPSFWENSYFQNNNNSWFIHQHMMQQQMMQQQMIRQHVPNYQPPRFNYY